MDRTSNARPGPSARREKAEEKRLDLAVQTRNFEIELFWKRSLYYWGFIATAFAGYAALRQLKSDLALVISCFGTVCAFAWTLVTRGSKYWQESWESKVDRYEAPVIGKFFASEEPVQTHKGIWLQARRYSVSKVSIALSDYVLIVWCTLLVAELVRRFAPLTWQPVLKEIGTAIFLLCSLLFLILLARFGRSSPRPDFNRDTRSHVVFSCASSSRSFPEEGHAMEAFTTPIFILLEGLSDVGKAEIARRMG